LDALHRVNSRFGYLPEQELRRIAQELEVPLSQIYGTASFYAAFSFKPRGRHIIRICQGTACYIRGGNLLEKLSQLLGIGPGETTEDLQFSLEVVRCVGACGMAPVVRINNDTYGRVRPDRLLRILEKYSQR